MTELPSYFSCYKCKGFVKLADTWQSQIKQLMNGEIDSIDVIHMECKGRNTLEVDDICWENGESCKSEW